MSGDDAAVVTWSDNDVRQFHAYIQKHVLTRRNLKEIEFRGRAGTGSEHLFAVGSGCCEDDGDGPAHPGSCQTHGCGNDGEHHRHHSNYSMKKCADDSVGALLDSIVASHALYDLLQSIATKASVVYDKVLVKGRAERNVASIPKEEAKQIRMDVVKEATIRAVLAEAGRQRVRSQVMDSREGGLLATPAGWRGMPLNNLTNETLHSLHHTGWAVQRGFVKNSACVKTVYNEVEMLEFETFLRDSTNGPAGLLRQDRCMWIYPGSIQKAKHPGLYEVIEHLESIPFELNKKCSTLCQVPAGFQLSMFPADGARHEKHTDGKAHSGSRAKFLKFTCMWFPNKSPWPEEDGGYVRLYSEGGELLANVPPAGDVLLLLNSSSIAWEVTPCRAKRFSFLFYIPGPGENTT